MGFQTGSNSYLDPRATLFAIPRIDAIMINCICEGAAWAKQEAVADDVCLNEVERGTIREMINEYRINRPNKVSEAITRSFGP